MGDQGSVECPNCGGSNTITDRRGYSWGKGAAGAILTGGIGLVAGAHGRKDIEIECLDCGEQTRVKRRMLKKESLNQASRRKKSKRKSSSKPSETAAGCLGMIFLVFLFFAFCG